MGRSDLVRRLARRGSHASLRAIQRRSNGPRRSKLFQGGLSEIHVSGANLIDVNGRLGTTPIVFYPNGPGSFAAIIGADVEAKPGLSKVLLTAIDRAGAQREREIPFRIKAKAFRKESFNVPPSFDQMSAGDARRDSPRTGGIRARVCLLGARAALGSALRSSGAAGGIGVVFWISPHYQRHAAGAA